MMFYRETNSIDGIKRLSDQDGTDDNDDAQVKTTNFSISEILRPEFGQRIKSEPSYPDAVSLKRENISAFSLVNNPSTYPLYSFGNIFRRYKNLMFSESHQDRQIKSRSHQSTEFAPLVTEQSELTLSSPKTSDTSNTCNKDSGNSVWPAWVYCTRYSDRPSAGPRAKKTKHRNVVAPEEKRPRTAFTNEQLNVLKREFNQCRYLTEKRRITLAKDLNLTESQIKIWFQNKRAKIKKTSDAKNTLALNLIAEGLYNHSTVNKSSCSSSDDD